ncbi:MAG TPA: DUF4160 domain-containing protein [Candidatus Cloacimonadota bacterium]|nr:DUF4160 domain-containing protein [Candidatus Cloacimonadota bacterium]
MPEICRFLGIIIYMYFNEHNPPHFHAKYNEHKASILIENLGILEGELPPKVYSIVAEWAMEHKAELLRNWHEMEQTGQFSKIEPYVK